METYYLAVDIGASGGRHILGCLDGNGHISLEEVYRFKNGAVKRNGVLCWDYERLFDEIIEGMRFCSTLGKVPLSMGIDTWGVDFILLDCDDKILGDTVAYRDERTSGVIQTVTSIISERDLYTVTGTQTQPFNTIYQLWTIRDQLKQAEHFLMTPDYFNYLLTGVKLNEYTDATTTGLVHAKNKTWSKDILAALDYPTKLFKELHMPGETVGMLKKEIADAVGYNCRVILPATHDTGAAVTATPLKDDSIYISSGTWSLMGIETQKPLTNERSRAHNFTNEGGWGCRFRYLKNIMGLWMIQELSRQFGGRYSFEELVTLAKTEDGFSSVVNVNDNRYLSPKSMTAAIQDECVLTGQRVPETPAQLAQCVFLSLAKSYSSTQKELQILTGRTFTEINIVGGGCQNDYLNQLTASETGLPVIAGPVEATALGNIIAQMIAAGIINDLTSARALIKNSFHVKEISPQR